MNPTPRLFCFIFGSLIFFSLFICAPMGINLTNFDGKCVLFATGNWTENKTLNTQELNISSWGKASDCNFVMFMGIISLLVSGFFFWRSLFFACKEHDGTPFYSFICMIVGSLITFSLVISSFIVSLGYTTWCDTIKSKPGDNSVCWRVDLGGFDKRYNVYSADFSTNLEIVEFGVWSSSLVWIAATIFLILKVRYFHKNDELMQSLAFEKNTLIPHRLRYRKIGDEDYDAIG